VQSNLFKRGFLSLLATQFFGAANDNILKTVLTYMVVDGAWRGKLGEGGQGLVGICFTVPFILLSGYAGQLADRFSKRSLSVIVKIAEIPIALLAWIGFWTDNLWLTLLSLIALTCQSAFFGPAKYGMIPEIVKEGDLSRANGTINMMTNVAVIAGTLLAGWVADHYAPQQVDGAEVLGRWLWLPGAAIMLTAILGLVSVVFLPPTHPGNRDVRYELNPLKTYFDSIREMSKTRILMVMMAWGYFYLLAGISLFIIPEYTKILGIQRFEASVLMGVMGVAIGVGCAAAGLISGHRIEPRLIPIGAIGLSFFFLLLGVVQPSLPDQAPMVRVALSNVSFFILGAGFFAGFYIVPLQSLLQKLSPDNERGRFLGTANALSFTFMTVSALFYWAIAKLFVGREHQIFIICALLMLAGTCFFLWRLRGSGIMFGKSATSTDS
jgi:acyl-[acyl-carrier-protein]-phospholipid O-acyltransferase/long-chain-fatty-acid--[acyl-carrier-protein] ligase